jgi:hypothetical protein
MFAVLLPVRNEQLTPAARQLDKWHLFVLILILYKLKSLCHQGLPGCMSAANFSSQVQPGCPFFCFIFFGQAKKMKI